MICWFIWDTICGVFVDKKTCSVGVRVGVGEGVGKRITQHGCDGVGVGVGEG